MLPLAGSFSFPIGLDGDPASGTDPATSPFRPFFQSTFICWPPEVSAYEGRSFHLSSSQTLAILRQGSPRKSIACPSSPDLGDLEKAAGPLAPDSIPADATLVMHLAASDDSRDPGSASLLLC